MHEHDGSSMGHEELRRDPFELRTHASMMSEEDSVELAMAANNRHAETEKRDAIDVSAPAGVRADSGYMYAILLEYCIKSYYVDKVSWRRYTHVSPTVCVGASRRVRARTELEDVSRNLPAKTAHLHRALFNPADVS